MQGKSQITNWATNLPQTWASLIVKRRILFFELQEAITITITWDEYVELS